MTSDYAVKVTVRNGRILSRMRQRGIKSLSELAQKAGIPYSKLCAIVALKQRPVGARGRWLAGVENVAGVLMCDVDDLFTDAQRENVVERNSSEIYVDEPDVMALTSGDPERAYWIRTAAEKLLESIPSERSRGVVLRRMDGDTLEQIGEDLGVCRDRVRQIEAKAFRQMRAVAARAGYRRGDLDAA